MFPLPCIKFKADYFPASQASCLYKLPSYKFVFQASVSAPFLCNFFLRAKSQRLMLWLERLLQLRPQSDRGAGRFIIRLCSEWTFLEVCFVLAGKSNTAKWLRNMSCRSDSPSLNPGWESKKAWWRLVRMGQPLILMMANWQWCLLLCTLPFLYQWFLLWFL